MMSSPPVPMLLYFNSQPHEEADLLSCFPALLSNYFNSQPHEEADDAKCKHIFSCFYFNSQPHEEADLNDMNSLSHISISTRSLTRRLTH